VPTSTDLCVGVCNHQRNYKVRADSCVQGEDGSSEIAKLSTTMVPLLESEKFTIFVPEDAAWPPGDLWPDGEELINVRSIHAVALGFCRCM
jgi:hypothetical protein